MGLIKTNYEIKELGVTIDKVYAKIVVLTSENKGQSVATLQIRKTKTEFDDAVLQPIKQTSIPFVADKTLPLWEQGYVEAKKSTYFEGWEDDFAK